MTLLAARRSRHPPQNILPARSILLRTPTLGVVTYRLTRLTPGDMGADQRATYEHLVAGKRGAGITAPDGSLIGPFDALLRAPGPGDRAQALGEALRFETTLDQRLLELAVCCVARHWGAQFEWWAHARLARKAGLDDATIEAIRTNRTPTSMAEDEAVVHGFATQLLAAHHVEDSTYAAATELLGERGVAELVLLVGYYGLVSGVLNCYQVPLPDGVEPELS